VTQPDENSRERPGDSSSREFWRRCRTTDAAEDEAARLLDLAGYAERRLDPDEHERVAAMLAADADAAADVTAARALAASAQPIPAADQSVIARAAALVSASEPQPGRVIPFRAGRRYRPSLQGTARWGSLAAAFALACWLGFAMGADATLALGPADRNSSEAPLLPDLLDPSPGFLNNLTDAQT
jgi:hypothetical protein